MPAAKCPICQQPITPVQLRVHSTCGKIGCRLAHRKAESERRWQEQNASHQQKFAAQLVSAESCRDRMANDQAIESPEEYHVIVAPVNRRPLVPLARRRRYQFVKKLIKIVEPVFADNEEIDIAPSRAEDESALPVLALMCGTCQGKCCVRGGTHAFLSADVIRRYRSDHPGATVKQIVADYCGRLPRASSDGSCVFHGDTGCSLPKTMRSATCNMTVCGALAEVRARSEVDGAEKFFIAAIADTEVIRSRFVDANTNGT